MKNKNIKIISVIIGILILIISIFYRNNYIVKNNKQIIKEMDESTQVSSLNSTINELNKAHEEYQTYIQNCKNQISTALTNEGVTTSNDAILETMASNISKVLQARTSDATAIEEDIAEGKTAYVNGNKITGKLKKQEIIYLGIGKSFDLTSYENYSDLTVDNFIIEPIESSLGAQLYNVGNSAFYTGYRNIYLNVYKTYTNGILKASVRSFAHLLGGSDASISMTFETTSDVKAYLIY